MPASFGPLDGTDLNVVFTLQDIGQLPDLNGSAIPVPSDEFAVVGGSTDTLVQTNYGDADNIFGNEMIVQNAGLYPGTLTLTVSGVPTNVTVSEITGSAPFSFTDGVFTASLTGQQTDTFSFAANATTGGGVPEPATYLLLAAGVAAVGGMFRRQRARSAAATSAPAPV